MANAVGSTRDRAVILGLWSCGLRVSTLCALNCGDVAEELESEERYLRALSHYSIQDQDKLNFGNFLMRALQ